MGTKSALNDSKQCIHRLRFHSGKSEAERGAEASSTVEPDLVFHVKAAEKVFNEIFRAFCVAETINNSLNKILQIHFHGAFEARA